MKNMTRLFCAIGFSVMLFPGVAFADIDEDYFRATLKRITKEEDSTIQDAQELFEHAFDAYRRGNYSWASRMAELGNVFLTISVVLSMLMLGF